MIMFSYLIWSILFQQSLHWSNIFSTKEPTSCFDPSSTLHELVQCLDTFTAPHGFYNSSTYDLAQPTDLQRGDWKDLVQRLLVVDGNCELIIVPSSLRTFYSLRAFQGFCILHETTAANGTFQKGWGFMVVPAFQTHISRHVHLSAPHPGYDLGTVEQAASIFQATGARSLLVAGRTRTAFLQPSNCIAPTSTSQDYYQTDPAHNNLEPFFDASVAIYDWQHHQSHGCPSCCCAFIQIHGKGRSTCSGDTVFLSTGLGNSSASKSWYTDNTDRPIKRLQHQLRHEFSSWQISLPSDSNCSLTATKNIEGRYINGIEESDVCNSPSNIVNVSGEFIHAEQASIARNRDHYDAWSTAILSTFDPIRAV